MTHGANQFAAESLRNNDPTGWFEQLYTAASHGEADVPWDSGSPADPLVDWVQGLDIAGNGRKAMVVGCGLGRDSEYIAQLGFDTVAFDVSDTAIATAKQRYPDSTVHYQTGDLLNPPKQWLAAFDLVVESMTVQALPQPPRHDAIVNVGRFVAPGGTLIACAYAHSETSSDDGPPWPLRRNEIEAFATDGLAAVNIEYLADKEHPEVHRWWRAEFSRP